MHPREIVLDKEGNFYVLDDGNSRVQKFSPDGEHLTSFGRRQDFSDYFSLQDGYDEHLVLGSGSGRQCLRGGDKRSQLRYFSPRFGKVLSFR